MKKKAILMLQLFAEGEAEQAQNGSEGAENSLEENQVAADYENGETGDAGASQQNGAKSRAESFSALINGEYKAEYQAALEGALSKRLKTSNKKLAKSEEFREQLTPVLEKLAVKYSIDDPTDIGAIIAAAEADNSYFEEFATKRGVDVEGAKQLIEAKRITEENARRLENERRELEFRNRFNGWLQQAQELKQKYPAFDFEHESSNFETGEEFRRLLNSGVDVESAYTVIHQNEIMGGAMRYAYERAKQDMADARTARSNRPNENGVSSNQASAILDDMAKLTPLQRQKIKAAVNRGERVSAENFRKFI